MVLYGIIHHCRLIIKVYSILYLITHSIDNVLYLMFAFSVGFIFLMKFHFIFFVVNFIF